MSVDLRRRYNEGTRREPAALFESGLGYRPAARKPGIPKDTVREWLFTYRAMGLKGLLSMGSRQARYTFEQKCDTARAVVDHGVAISDALARAMINGDYGNGEERKRRLGSNYAAVQRRMNQMLS